MRVCKVLLCMIISLISLEASLPIHAQSEYLPLSLNIIKNISQIGQLGKGRIAHFDWTTDGKLIAVSSAGGWIYDLEQTNIDQPEQLLNHYDGHVVAVRDDLVFLLYPDSSIEELNRKTSESRIIVPASDENSINVRVDPTGTKLAFIRSSFSIPSPMSKDNFAIHIWDIETATELFTLTDDSYRVPDLKFSKNGGFLAAISSDGKVHVWNLLTREFHFLSESKDIEYSPVVLELNHDGTLLITGSLRGYIQIWDTMTQSLRQSISAYTESVYAMALSPDGKFLASGGWRDQTIRIWNVHTGKLVTTLTGHSATIRSLSFSPDGTLLVSGSDDETVRIWDVSTWKTTAVLEGYTNDAWDIAFKPNSNILAAAALVDPVHLWNVSTGKRLPPIHADAESLVFTSDGKKLFTGGFRELVEWDVQTGTQSAVLDKGQIRAVAISPDNRILASASDTVKLWEISSHSLQFTLNGHKDALNDLAFSPDGKYLASISGIPQGDVIYESDNSLRIWNTRTGKEIKKFDGISHMMSVAFSPDGKLIAAGNWDGSIQLLQVEKLSEIAVLKETPESINSVAFSSDGSLLFAGSLDGGIYIWDLNQQKCIKILREHTSSVEDLALNSDGIILASASYDGTIRLWAVKK